MHTRVWLLLVILTLQVGCAPGYHDTGASSSEGDTSLSPMTFQNQETPEETTDRIWRESIGG